MTKNNNNKIKMLLLTLAIPGLFIAGSAKAESSESNACEDQAAACENLREECKGSAELCFEKELDCLAGLGDECFELGDDVLEDDGVLDDEGELEDFDSELE